MKITLCGSTRFREQYEAANQLLSKQGHVVYSVSCFGHSGDKLAPDKKKLLDRVHLKKIDNSEGIVVINVDGYIGESTAREIAHAIETNKRVWYLVPCRGGWRVCPHKGCTDSLQPAPCALCYE